MRGEELRQLRVARGLKSKELAMKLDIHEATLSRFEHGHRPIPKTVEYAARYICEETAGVRLISALKEALDYAAGNPGKARMHRASANEEPVGDEAGGDDGDKA